MSNKPNSSLKKRRIGRDGSTSDESSPVKNIKVECTSPECETNGEENNATTTSEPEENTQTSTNEDQEKLLSEMKALFEPLNCRLCSIPFSSNITAYTHYKGKLHAKKMKTYLIEHKLPLPEPVKVPPKEDKLDACLKEDFPSDEDFPLELKAMFEPLECKLCKVVSLSKIPAHDHYNGKNHKKKVKEYLLSHRTKERLKVVDEKSSQLSCSVCKILFTSIIHANQHYIGKKHQAKLKSGPDETIPIPVPKAKEDPSGRFGIGEAFIL